jgi:PAS domain S-box-containing protein
VAQNLGRLERALDRLSRLQRVTASLSEALTPRRVAEVVVGQGVAALDAQAGRISLLRRDEHRVDVIGFSGYTRVNSPFRPDEPLPTSEVLRTGQPLFVPTHAEVLARFPRDRDMVEPVLEGALASAPLIDEGRVMGAMTVSFSRDREFDAEDRDLLVALATLCAQALERARLYELSLAVQEDLRQSRDQLAATLGGIAEGVTVQDAEGRLIYANEVAARNSGYDSAAAMVGDGSHVLERFALLDEAGEPLSADRLPGRRILHDEPAEEVVVRFVDPDSGKSRWSIVDARPVRDPDGRLRLIVNIFRDITERIRHTDALQATIEERDRAVAELQRAVRTRDEFLASASHDLKNPLTSIKATAQLLQRRLDRADDVDRARISEGLQRVDAIATRAAGLVEELIDLTREQMGQLLDLDRQPTDLVALAREVASEHQQATERHVVEVRADADQVIGQWDARRLGRVLSNLLDNAIKYSPDGGSIAVHVQTDGNWASVSVSDSGLGIPPSELDDVFERFQRGSNVAQRIGGTGIGLASVRQIVENHGGSVAAHSHEGAGSTFVVRLPLSA